MIIFKKYIKGFTLIEMLISIIITLSVTLAMMFVYNQTIKKFYVDSMEYDIKVYCNRAVEEIAELVSDIVTEVEQTGLNRYRLTFYDVDKYGVGSEREISISVNNTDGVVVKEGNTDVTNTIFDGVLLNGDIFISHLNDRDLNLPIKYVISEFKIENLTGDSLYHQMNPSRVRAMSVSSYEIYMQVEIQNKLSENDGSTKFYKYLNFSRRSFSPGLYLREKSKHNQNEI